MPYELYKIIHLIGLAATVAGLGGVAAHTLAGVKRRTRATMGRCQGFYCTAELARLTNRDDIPNIQYSMRKLVSEGFVKKQGSGRSGVTYQATEKGKKITDDYGDIRRRLLIEQIKSLPEFDQRLKDASQSLNILAGIYEEISRIAATHRR